LAQVCVTESVTALSTNIPLNNTVFGGADSIFPAFIASTLRTYNGGDYFQLLFALPFGDKMDF